MEKQSTEAVRTSSADTLLPAVYAELRRLAAFKMAREAPGQTLQPTALVHEAWLRVAGDNNLRFNDRAHFFRVAAEAMRRILIDRARRRQCIRHGGGQERTDLEVKLRFFVGLSDAEVAEVLEISERTVERHWAYAKVWLLRAVREGR